MIRDYVYWLLCRQNKRENIRIFILYINRTLDIDDNHFLGAAHDFDLHLHNYCIGTNIDRVIISVQVIPAYRQYNIIYLINY